MGMDADLVAQAGKALKDRAGEIDALVAKLDAIVRSIHGVWEGPDSDQFVNEWWPEHKKTLVAASSHVSGLGQSALNNASEQRDASHAGGSGAAPNHSDTGTPSAQPPATSTPQSQGGPLSPPPSQDAFNARGGGYGDLSPGGANDGQCTSWVAFRRDQLGLTQPPVGYNGGQWADVMPAKLEAPVPGAVGSTDNHTFMVEAVRGGPPMSIDISEMNFGQPVPGQPPWVTTGLGQVHTDTYNFDPSTGLWKSNSRRSEIWMKFGT
jgi:surface antigen/uncharacterized protein YukE